MVAWCGICQLCSTADSHTWLEGKLGHRCKKNLCMKNVLLVSKSIWNALYQRRDKVVAKNRGQNHQHCPTDCPGFQWRNGTNLLLGISSSAARSPTSILCTAWSIWCGNRNKKQVCFLHFGYYFQFSSRECSCRCRCTKLKKWRFPML